MKIRTYILVMTSFFMVTVPTYAMDKAAQDSEQLLLKSCQVLKTNPEQGIAQACRYFIKGFLAGDALSSGSENTALLGAGESSWTSFEKRAYRTRVGTRGERIRKPQFCIPHDETPAHIIERLSQQALFPSVSTKSLAIKINRALSSEYPCT
ncbi:MAG: hypothetical protein KUG82_15265 [Pseudomonadales bacterium]|nr:hypothetical protein [Pseudomonadales bacterium]